MFEQPPGWTVDKERERIRNLAASYYVAKEELNAYVAQGQKLEGQRLLFLIGGVVAAAAGVLMAWWVLVALVAIYMPGVLIYARRDLRNTNELIALRRTEMKRLREYLEEVGLSPHSPWTVEKDGQVLGFVPLCEPVP